MFGGDDDIDAAAADTVPEAAATPAATPLAAALPAEAIRSFSSDGAALLSKDLRFGGPLFGLEGGFDSGLPAGKSGTEGMGRFDIVFGDVDCHIVGHLPLQMHHRYPHPKNQAFPARTTPSTSRYSPTILHHSAG